MYYNYSERKTNESISNTIKKLVIMNHMNNQI